MALLCCGWCCWRQDTYLSLDDPGLVYFLALGLLRLKRDLLLEADMGEVGQAHTLAGWLTD